MNTQRPSNKSFWMSMVYTFIAWTVLCLIVGYTTDNFKSAVTGVIFWSGGFVGIPLFASFKPLCAALKRKICRNT